VDNRANGRLVDSQAERGPSINNGILARVSRSAATMRRSCAAASHGVPGNGGSAGGNSQYTYAARAIAIV
jgi:hypothetical protein